jgi:hypothetical protein
VIPGLCDAAVEEYSDWQIGRVGRDDLKQGIRDVRDIVLEQGFDLVQIYENQDSNLFVQEGVKPGIAQRFVRDIEYWVTHYKGSDGMEMPSDSDAADDSCTDP